MVGREPKGWYYRVEEKDTEVVRGPYTTTEMNEFFTEGSLSRETAVRFGTENNWYPAYKVFPFNRVDVPVTRGSRGIYVVVGLLFVGTFLLALLWTLRERGTEQKEPRTRTIPAPSAFPSSAPSRGPSSPRALSSQILQTEIPPPVTPPPEASYVPLNLTRSGIIALTNKARANTGGLAPLSENELLNAVAVARLQDMMDNKYFAHLSPTGESASDIAQKVGYHYKIIAENIAKGQFTEDQKMVNGWLQSPGHRANLLSPEVTEIGVALARDKVNGQDIWTGVQVFGLPSPPVGSSAAKSSRDSCTRPSAGLKETIEQSKAELFQLSASLVSMREELENLKRELETQRRSGYKDPALLADYNDKIRLFNSIVEQARGKKSVIERMIETYNTDVTKYNECQNGAMR
jgi:uncharacterized protein YkwD